MKPLIIALLLVGAPLARAAGAAGVTLYVQLVQGSDQDSPPLPQARAIGPKLDRRLHNVFRWKNYWELKRETVSLTAGQRVRKRMSPHREVEIAWPTAESITISIYTNGKLTRKRTQPLATAFSIAGGDQTVTQPWFIIVRRDNPDENQESNTKLAAMP